MSPAADSMQELVAGLLLFVQSELGLFNPIEPPHIEFMPATEISDVACNQPCDEIKGWAPPGDTIYLSNDLRVGKDDFDRSILLHELVHYVQYKHELVDMTSSCLTWKARESQAYELQYEWLRINKVRYNTYDFKVAMQNFHRVQCPAEEGLSAKLSVEDKSNKHQH